jgi:hypothetical protein
LAALAEQVQMLLLVQEPPLLEAVARQAMQT